MTLSGREQHDERESDKKNSVRREREWKGYNPYIKGGKDH